jgi:uncharacterized protein
MRLHLLESESSIIRDKYGLSTAENIAALRAFRNLQPQLKRLRTDLFEDMTSLLLGRDEHTTCVWNACDSYTTRAVRGVEGNGQRSNCGRTNKDGIDFLKADQQGFERYLALYATPHACGGCQGCRFFLMCKGQCPGTAIEGDWRNRTEHCEVWIALFSDIEQDLLQNGSLPLSLDARRSEIERHIVDAWTEGQPMTTSRVIASLEVSEPDEQWRKQLDKLRQKIARSTRHAI